MTLSPSRLAAAGLGLEELEMPALIAWGAQDPWFGPELAQRYAERLPQAELEVIEAPATGRGSTGRSSSTSSPGS